MRRLLAMSAFVILLAPLLSAGVKTDYNHSVDFAKYRTFAWKTPPPKPPNGMVNNSLVYTRIEQAVDQQLVKRGMRESKQNPDVYLTYRLTAEHRRSVNYVPGFGWGGPRWGWGWGWRGGWGWGGSDVFVDRYLQGNIVIDMTDAHTNRLVWRAYGEDSGSYLSDVESSKNIDKMMAKAFKHFPPTNTPSA